MPVGGTGLAGQNQRRARGDGSAREDVEDRARRPRRTAAKTELSVVFQANARGFYVSAVAGQDRFPRPAAHFLAIAIELSLKSYLLHRGLSDDWNRVHIGHDLVKALSCVRRAGFRAIPSDLPGIAALLSPLYLRHAFHRLSPGTVATLRGLRAYDVVRILLDNVGEAIGQAAPLGGQPSSRRRSANAR
jgi:hypothetical protein